MDHVEDVHGFEVLGGPDWSRKELDTIAAGTDVPVPLLADHEQVGTLTKVYREGQRLLADARVPARIARLLRTGAELRRIGTLIDRADLGRGVQDVLLLTTAAVPARDYGGASADCVKTYEFDARQLILGAIVRRENASMKPGTVLARYEGLPGDIVMQRVAAYRANHPQVSVEMATKSVLDLDPLLKQAYVQAPWVSIPPTGGSPMQEPANADVFQQAQAEAHHRATARAAKDGLAYEVALRLVLGEDDVLRRQYLGRL